MSSPKGSRPRRRTGAFSVSARVYRSLLRAYPRPLRDEYGDEMVRCFRNLCREAHDHKGGWGLAALWAHTLPELLCTACKERSTVLARNAYRVAVGVALAASCLLAWLSLGVGVIGADGDPANAMYAGVLAIGIVGAISAHFRPQGMARALFATALAQAVVAVIALILGLGAPWSPPSEIVTLNGFFVALFVASAVLFRSAAREPTTAHAGPRR
jgi:hypothetical protein